MYDIISSDRIGKQIREMRISRGMNAEDLAREIGTSTSAVIMYECGRRVPRDEIKVRIANFFGTTMENIFYPKKKNET